MRRILFLLLLIGLPTIAVSAEKVTLQLRWDHQFQFAGYYAAQWRGDYAAAGFEVAILSAIAPDGRILKAPEEVASGRVDYGVGGADILIARDGGAPLVVLASILKQSAAAFFALEDTPLSGPADLLDLRVARNPEDLIDIELQAMLMAGGIDPGRIRPHPHQPGIDHLMGRQVDVIPGYVITIPFLAERRGARVKMLRPVDFGVDFYGDTLFCRQWRVQQNPDSALRFTRASLEGWRYALAHPEEIADRIANTLPRRAPIPDGDLRAFNHFQIAGVTRLSLYPYVDIGHINPDRWRRMNDFMKKIGIVKTDLDTAAFVFDPERLDHEKQIRRQARILKVLFMVTAIALSAMALVLLIRRRAAGQMMKYQQIVSSTPDAMAFLDDEYRYRIANDAYERFSNVPRHRFLGLSVAEYMGESVFRLRIKPHFDRCLAGEIVRLQEWFDYPNLGRRFVSVTYFPYRDTAGRIQGVVASTRDITDRKRAEEKLKHYTERLQEMVDARTAELKNAQKELLIKERLAVLGHFAGSLSHEIRNPLAAIDSAAYYLKMKMGGREEKADGALRRITDNVKKATAIIQSLLDLTREEHPRAERHCLATLAEETIRSEIAQAGLEPEAIAVDLDFPSPPVYVKIDPEQIRMALKNIVKNALQAMGGSGRIGAYLRVVEGGRAELTISDTGPGIPPEHLDQVFKPLFTTKTHGIGFGLSIAGMIVEKHGGAIRADSLPGAGARFALTLPLDRSGENGGRNDERRV